MERRVRPTLVIGMGAWGAQVARAFGRRMAKHTGRLPVVRAVALVWEREGQHKEQAEQKAEHEGFEGHEGREEGTELGGGDGFFEVVRIPPPQDGKAGSWRNRVSPELTAALIPELERIRRFDGVQQARRAGWAIAGEVGSGVVLVASLGVGEGEDDQEDEITGWGVVGLARWLCEYAGRDPAHQLGLSGVFFLPRQGAPPAQAEAVRPCRDGSAAGAGERPDGQTPSQAGRDSTGRAADLGLLDEGCYLVGQVNADGLLLTDRAEQAEMVANWLALGETTDLRAAIDRLPPPCGDTHPHYDTLGLAAWEFPLESLRAHLVRRWQWEVLDRLLTDPAGGRGSAGAFLERHGRDGPLGIQATDLRFRVSGDSWTTPPLDRVSSLREEMEEAVAAEKARLNALGMQVQGKLDTACDEVQDALVAEVDAVLDGPGLGAAGQLLAALEDATRARVARLEREAEQRHARIAELDGPVEEVGQRLDDLTGRFPPFRLRALFGVVLRPWRLLPLWLLYREIGRQAGVYLAYRQSQWILDAEARERTWRAAFYARLIQMIGEERAAIEHLRSRLIQLRERLSPGPAPPASSGTEGPAPVHSLAVKLEAAALPADLADRLYRRAMGDGREATAGLLALYGPLSRWMREDRDAGALGLTLAEHAREQFAFLSEVRLDDLLAHTHGGTELRRRLAALLEAAAPWWSCDEVAMGGNGGGRTRRMVLVGLPDAGSSPLVDLLPDRPLHCFSTGDLCQVVAIQIVQGLAMGDLRWEVEG